MVRSALVFYFMNRSNGIHCILNDINETKSNSGTDQFVLQNFN